MGLEERKTKGFLHVVVLWAKVVLKMLFTSNNNKEEWCEHNKTHDLISQEKLINRESLGQKH